MRDDPQTLKPENELNPAPPPGASDSGADPQATAAPAPGGEEPKSKGRKKASRSVVPAGLEDIFEGVPKDASRVQIKQEVDGDWAHLATWDASAVSFDSIRRKWGGGRFKLVVRDSDGQYTGTRDFVIAGDPIPQGGKPEAPAPGDVLLGAKEKLDEIHEALKHPPAGTPQSNPLEMMAAIMTSLSAIQTPYLEMMKASLEKKGKGDSSEKLLGMFEKMLDVRDRLNPPATSDDSKFWDRVVDKVGIPLVEEMKKQSGGPVPQGAGFPPGIKQLLDHQIPSLLVGARDGLDPLSIVDNFMDRAPEVLITPLAQFVQQPSVALGEIFQRYPGTLEFAPWFHDLLWGFHDYLYTPGASEMEGGPSDDGHPSIDEDPSRDGSGPPGDHSDVSPDHGGGGDGSRAGGKISPGA